MKFKIGDYVRFLNEAVEGNISRLLSNERVEVVDTHGFLHIAESKHLVLIELILDQSDLIEKSKVETLPEKIVSKPKSSTGSEMIKSLEPDNTVYAAIRLLDEKSPLTTDIELHLLNNSQFSICYTLSRKHDDVRTGLTAGTLDPRCETRTGIFSQDELHRFDGFEFQFLFFHKDEYKPRPPAIKTLQFSSSDFINTEYRKLYYQHDDTILLLPLYSVLSDEKINISKLVNKFRQSSEEEEKRNVKNPKEKNEKFTVLTRQKVVDLHIEELLKDHSGMNNSQIISYQINFFLYEMDQAAIQKLHTITFIHGVGNGVLRSSIREELKRYPNIKFKDAPQEKYGYGATEVEFH